MYRVKEKRKIGIQVGCPSVDRIERGVQCSNSKSSYGRKEIEARHVTFEDLLQNYLWDKEYTLSWLKEEGFIASKRLFLIVFRTLKEREINTYFYLCSARLKNEK